MSFSVQTTWAHSGQKLEWNGANLNSVFAQRSNLLRPKFWRLLQDILRFNKLATALAQAHNDGALMQPLQAFLDTHGFGIAFRDGYLLPMLGCIWSCPTSQMLHSCLMCLQSAARLLHRRLLGGRGDVQHH
jgi:predicted NAD/FAD-binding protein